MEGGIEGGMAVRKTKRKESLERLIMKVEKDISLDLYRENWRYHCAKGRQAVFPIGQTFWGI
jgi:hypothetical protein